MAGESTSDSVRDTDETGNDCDSDVTTDGGHEEARPALQSYGGYFRCPDHPSEVMSAAHDETCPQCGWPDRDDDTTSDYNSGGSDGT